jgi:hypothetical protein
MSAQLLSSKIVVQEEQPSLRIIQGVATGVVACLGITARGPVGTPTLLTSFEQFVRIYGSDISAGIACSAVRGFFSGGGERMYFSRVVHYTDITNPNSKTSAFGSLQLLSQATVAVAAQITGTVGGPFALTNGDTLVVSRDAAGQATATFTATRAQVVSDGAEPYTLVNGDTLQVRVDGGTTQTVTFNTADFVDIANATDNEVAAVLTQQVNGANTTVQPEGIRIQSNTAGTSSGVEIVGGPAAAKLDFDVSVATGTGNVADISEVTVAEIKTVVETAVSGVTVTNAGGAVRITATTAGPSGLVQVQVASTADDELGLNNLTHNGGNGTAQPTLLVTAKYDGSYAAGVSILIGPATSKIATEFNLSVVVNGLVAETFPNLSMLDSASRNVVKVINAEDGSNLIQVEDLNVSPGNSGAAAERPANSPGSPAVAFGPMADGDDGLTSIGELDFVGDEAGRLGFHAFDLIDDVELLICPEMATPAIQNAALSYVSVYRNGEMFFIADPPAGMSPDAMVQYVVQTAAIKNSTEHGAIYWPRVKVLNPNPNVYGTAATIVIPPCGHIAGMYARTDGSRVGGVYQPPGGVERGLLPGVIGFENELCLSERVRDLLAPNLINPITRVRGQPIAVDDVLTLRATGPFPTIAERRGVTFIERSVKDGMQFARLRNNDEVLRDEVYRTVVAFLVMQMRCGAFRSTDPALAFYVDTGEAINPPTEQFAGKLHCNIGLATQKPARFIILSFAQDTRAIDEELAAAG